MKTIDEFLLEAGVSASPDSDRIKRSLIAHLRAKVYPIIQKMKMTLTGHQQQSQTWWDRLKGWWGDVWQPRQQQQKQPTATSNESLSYALENYGEVQKLLNEWKGFMLKEASAIDSILQDFETELYAAIDDVVNQAVDDAFYGINASPTVDTTATAKPKSKAIKKTKTPEPPAQDPSSIEPVSPVVEPKPDPAPQPKPVEPKPVVEPKPDPAPQPKPVSKPKPVFKPKAQEVKPDLDLDAPISRSPDPEEDPLTKHQKQAADAVKEKIKPRLKTTALPNFDLDDEEEDVKLPSERGEYVDDDFADFDDEDRGFRGDYDDPDNPDDEEDYPPDYDEENPEGYDDEDYENDAAAQWLAQNASVEKPSTPSKSVDSPVKAASTPNAPAVKTSMPSTPTPAPEPGENKKIEIDQDAPGVMKFSKAWDDLEDDQRVDSIVHSSKNLKHRPLATYLASRYKPEKIHALDKDIDKLESMVPVNQFEKLGIKADRKTGKLKIPGITDEGQYIMRAESFDALLDSFRQMLRS